MASNIEEVFSDKKSVIRNVVKVCQEEREDGYLKESIERPYARAAIYTGVSESTCRRLMKMSVVSKKRKSRRDRHIVDDFDKGVIRRTIHSMLQSGSSLPTVKLIKSKLVESINFPRSTTYLKKLLKEMGFVWCKCQSNRTVLMERTDVAVARIQFLRSIKRYREEGRPIIYTDETFVHSTHTVKKCWQSEEHSLKIPFTKGQRLIVVHAGSKDGFLDGAGLVFKAKSSTGDYHSEMNGTNFFKWLEERLIPNLAPKSVLVVDNAPYHGIQLDRCPTQTTRKADIMAWLDSHAIRYSAKMLRCQLLELCKRNKPAPKYVLDTTLEKHGHTCLRLPPYHAELNAIELIWAMVKRKVAASNLTFKMKDVSQLTQTALDSISGEDWEGCCRHVEDVEKTFWASDIAVDNNVDDVVIEVTDEEGTDTGSEGDSSTDTASEYDTDTASENEM